MKIKTFLFEEGTVAQYSRSLINKTDGRFSYVLDPAKVDLAINKFVKGKKVVSITQSSFVKGNNPPTTILMYTIVYEE